MLETKRIIEALSQQQVEYLIIGGVAAVLYGSGTATYDLDICYRKTGENIDKLVAALQGFKPKLRGVKEEIPFVFDVRSIRNGMNFTFTTDAGDIDLLAEVIGVGQYEDMIGSAETYELFEHKCRVISLQQLIDSKKAAGRQKDLHAIHELEIIKDAKNQRG